MLASINPNLRICPAFVLCRPFPVNELDDLRNQLGGHHHDGLVLGPKGLLVFGNLFVLGLIVVVLGKLADSFFIPSGGILLLSFSHFPFLRWRLRNPRLALGDKSYAVTTNTPSPASS